MKNKKTKFLRNQINHRIKNNYQKKITLIVYYVKI